MQIIAQDKIIEATDLEKNSEGVVDKIIKKITGMKGMVVMIEIGTGQERELLQGIMVMEQIEAISNDRSRSVSRASTNSNRIRCYACRKYDHFVRGCPKSREERDLEQLQHMLNRDEQDH